MTELEETKAVGGHSGGVAVYGGAGDDGFQPQCPSGGVPDRIWLPVSGRSGAGRAGAHGADLVPAGI